MNLFIKYKSDISLDIELLDTPAVKKWVFCFLSNKHLTPMESVRTYWNQGAHNPPNYTPGTKKLLSKKINDAISIINGVIAGQEFPYQAKEEMSINRQYSLKGAKTVTIKYNLQLTYILGIKEELKEEKIGLC